MIVLQRGEKPRPEGEGSVELLEMQGRRSNTSCHLPFLSSTPLLVYIFMCPFSMAIFHCCSAVKSLINN